MPKSSWQSSKSVTYVWLYAIRCSSPSLSIVGTNQDLEHSPVRGIVLWEREVEE